MYLTDIYVFVMNIYLAFVAACLYQQLDAISPEDPMIAGTFVALVLPPIFGLTSAMLMPSVSNATVGVVVVLWIIVLAFVRGLEWKRWKD